MNQSAGVRLSAVLRSPSARAFRSAADIDRALASTSATLSCLNGGLPVWIVAALGGGLIGTQLGSRWLPVAVLRYLLAAVLAIAGLKLIFT